MMLDSDADGEVLCPACAEDGEQRIMRPTDYGARQCDKGHVLFRDGYVIRDPKAFRVITGLSDD